MGCIFGKNVITIYINNFNNYKVTDYNEYKLTYYNNDNEPDEHIYYINETLCEMEIKENCSRITINNKEDILLYNCLGPFKHKQIINLPLFYNIN